MLECIYCENANEHKELFDDIQTFQFSKFIINENMSVSRWYRSESTNTKDQRLFTCCERKHAFDFVFYKHLNDIILQQKSCWQVFIHFIEALLSQIVHPRWSKVKFLKDIFKCSRWIDRFCLWCDSRVWERTHESIYQSVKEKCVHCFCLPILWDICFILSSCGNNLTKPLKHRINFWQL